MTGAMHQVLVVEDDDGIRNVLRVLLEAESYRVVEATTAHRAEIEARSHKPDLLLVDLGLPDGDGLSWCQALRAGGVGMPILVLTARSAVSTRVAGLDAGADDFLAKPFAVAELRARVRALGRRGPLRRPSELRAGEVHLDFGGRRARVGAKEVPLTNREWSVVELLVSRSGEVVHRGEILELIWGSSGASAEASLEVIVGRIRKKLGAAFVRTVRGEGYATG